MIDPPMEIPGQSEGELQQEINDEVALLLWTADEWPFQGIDDAGSLYDRIPVLTSGDGMLLVIKRLKELGYWTIVNWHTQDGVSVQVGSDVDSPVYRADSASAPDAVLKAALNVPRPL